MAMESLSAPLFWTLVLYSLSFPVLCFVLGYGLMRSSLKRWSLQRRFRGVLDKDAEIARLEATHRESLEELNRQAQAVRDETAALQANYKQQHASYEALLRQVAVFDDSIAYAGFGVYAPHFDFGDAEAYRNAILEVREQQKAMIAANKAVLSNKEPDASVRGETPTSRALKLTLRAFNGEADAAIANVRWNNVGAMEQRIIRAREQLDRLNAGLGIFIEANYSALKLKELYLAHEHREKLKAETEQRAELARRAVTEQKLKRDLDLAMDEEERFGRLLAQARLEASKFVGARLKTFAEQIASLERELAAAQNKAMRARGLLDEQRSGYVYILSNIGAFGETVFKVGMTRRLDPADRIRELGLDAVPFAFDTHAVIHSNDAVALERSLHLAFRGQEINPRRPSCDFFRVGIDALEAVVRKIAPDAEFVRQIEARDYRETLELRGEALPLPVSDMLPEAI
jgi:uncharacterized protein DUF4041/Meiotically Up-regulated Gene 113 (MUG113) protein